MVLKKKKTAIVKIHGQFLWIQKKTLHIIALQHHNIDIHRNKVKVLVWHEFDVTAPQKIVKQKVWSVKFWADQKSLPKSWEGSKVS